MNYSSSGVDYTKIDPLKKLAQKLAKTTSQNSNIKIVEESRGETAFVWEEQDSYKAFVIESLGTKSLIADEMRKITGKTYYDFIAQDTVAMIVNDLIAVGAKPQVINAYFAAGSSDWFADEQRAEDLIQGWANACKLSGAVWGGGESPSLSGIINPDVGELAGSAIGIIKPKQRLTLGAKLKPGDIIILIESSGLHCNGASLVRKIATDLPTGFSTKLANGNYFGEDALSPTHIYAKVLEALFAENIDLHYLINITGHGWRKLMRANQEFSYVIDEAGNPQEIFEFIQKSGNLSDTEMYETFNMGAGFGVYVGSQDAEKAVEIIGQNGFKAWVAGKVEGGPKQVVIKPKNITFEEGTLNLR